MKQFFARYLGDFATGAVIGWLAADWSSMFIAVGVVMAAHVIGLALQ